MKFTTAYAYAAAVTLFASSASAKMGEHRNLHAKVDALESKIAKVDALESKIAKLEALLMGTPRAAPQGKKNLRRSLESDLVVDTNATTTTEEDGTPEEKADALVAQFGFHGVLKKILLDLDPVYNCLGFDKDTQTCTLGSSDIDSVDIIAEQDIDIVSFEGGDIDIDAQEGDVDIDAGDNEVGGDVFITAEDGDTDDEGEIFISGYNGVDIESDDGFVTIDASDDVTIDGSRVDIDGRSGVDIDANTVNSDINIRAEDINLIAGDDDDGSITLLAANDIDLTAGLNLNDVGDINLNYDGDLTGNSVVIVP